MGCRKMKKDTCISSGWWAVFEDNEVLFSLDSEDASSSFVASNGIRWVSRFGLNPSLFTVLNNKRRPKNKWAHRFGNQQKLTIYKPYVKASFKFSNISVIWKLNQNIKGIFKATHHLTNTLKTWKKKKQNGISYVHPKKQNGFCHPNNEIELCMHFLCAPLKRKMNLLIWKIKF